MKKKILFEFVKTTSEPFLKVHFNFKTPKGLMKTLREIEGVECCNKREYGFTLVSAKLFNLDGIVSQVIVEMARCFVDNGLINNLGDYTSLIIDVEGKDEKDRRTWVGVCCQLIMGELIDKVDVIQIDEPPLFSYIPCFDGTTIVKTPLGTYIMH